MANRAPKKKVPPPTTDPLLDVNDDDELPVTTDEYFAMTNVNKLEHLQGKIDNSMKKKRLNDLIDREERMEFNSNYKTVLDMIAMPSQASGGAHTKKTGEPQYLGPILAQVKKEEREARAGSDKTKATSLRSAVTMAKKMSLFARRSTQSVPTSLTTVAKEEGVLDASELLKTAEPNIANGVRSIVSTQTRQNILEETNDRNKRLKQLDHSFEENMMELRPKLLRRQSFPPVVGHMGVLRNAHEEVQELVKENEELMKVNAGKEPRDEEKKLKRQVAALEEQITNQVSLIKGLREKVKILKEGGKDAEQHVFINTAAREGAPRGETVTVVVTDVQSAAYLWESQPSLMKAEVVRYKDLMREELAQQNGYEVSSHDDRFMFAFSNPLDACIWAIQVQLKLCELPWDPDMNENADTPAELLAGSQTEYLWRGLRIRMGIEVRARLQIDPLNPRATYEGEGVDRASYLEQLALGGEILISEAVNDNVCGMLSSLGRPLIQPWGNLTLHHKGTGVFRLIPDKLKERIHGFQRNLMLCESGLEDQINQAMAGAAHPPGENVTIATILFNDIDVLRTSMSAEGCEDVLKEYNELLQKDIRYYRGYITSHNDLQTVVAFPDDITAAQCVLAIQESLLDADWPEELLRITQFSTVRVKGRVLYHGPRALIGMHTVSKASMFRDPLTSLMQYRAPDARFSSILALKAVPGEILITPVVVESLTTRIEAIKYPIMSFSVEVSVPATDALLQAYHLCPLNLKTRIGFAKRDMQLKEEGVDTHAGVVRTLQNQIAVLQSKLSDKDHWIERLEEQLIEKNRVIGNVREEVLGAPFTELVVRDKLRLLDTAYTPRSNCCLVAMGFAHTNELLDKWVDEMVPALRVWNELLDSMALTSHGYEIRRLPSSTERIFAFSDPVRAAEFWLSVCRNSLYCDWPEKLEDSEEAGAVLASEVIPGIHPSQETLVWKGLRPKCAMDLGTPQPYFNVCSKAHESIGDDINHIAVLLREAHEGDCVITPDLAEELRAKQDRLNEALITDYGFYARLQPAEMKIRNRILHTVFSQEQIDSHAPVRSETAVIVHVTMEYPDAVAESIDLNKDVKLFDDLMMTLIARYKGHIVSSEKTEYGLAFTDIGAGCMFAVNLHISLLKVDWSQELLRVGECKEISGGTDSMLFRGLRARVGVHYAENIAVTIDTFTGSDLWIHDEASTAFILSQSAHYGETLMTESAKDEFSRHAQLYNRDEYVKVFFDAVGTVAQEQGMLPSNLYQVLPSSLKFRASAFINEDKIRANPLALEKKKMEERKEMRRREKHAQKIKVERGLLGALERNENPLADPIHRKNAKLHQIVKGVLDEEHQKANTAQSTLAVLETISMMSEDPFYIGDDVGNPYHTHLLLHQLEHSSLCQDPFFRKGYAASLIDDSKPPEGVSPGSTPEASDLSPTAASTTDSIASSPRSKKGSRRLKPSKMPAIMTEDLVQLHIAVEKFANLVTLFGIADADKRAAVEWAKDYEQYVPLGYADSLEDKLREMASQTMAIGMEVDAALDPDVVRKSVVANLSIVLKKLVVDRANNGSVQFA